MSAAVSRAKFPWRALLYSAVILYLLIDLHWCRGPLKRKIEQHRPFTEYSRATAVASGWVATVNQEPITGTQLDQATAVYLFRQGKRWESMSPQARTLAKRAALAQLIEDTIVRQYAAAEAFTPDPAGVDRRVAEFESQFASPESLDERLKAMGLDMKSLRVELTEQERQRQWLETRLAEAATVTDGDIAEWHQAHAVGDEGATNPALVRARHIFVATGVEDTPEREARIRECQRLLESGEMTFEALAAAFSEDERTKRDGGDLGWFGRDRMPAPFAEEVFALKPGERSTPFRSPLGWHIVEVTDAKPAEKLDLEALRPEIRAWLETERRRYALRVLLNRLRNVSKVEVFPVNFDRPAS